MHEIMAVCLHSDLTEHFSTSIFKHLEKLGNHLLEFEQKILSTILANSLWFD